MNSILRERPEVGLLIIRIGLAFVMFWFGYHQIADALKWVGILPDWVLSLPISSVNFVHINGWSEVVLGFLLLVGVCTRWVALILAIHIFGIAFVVGGFGSPTGVRDIGLAVSLLSIFFMGAGALSVDHRRQK